MLRTSEEGGDGLVLQVLADHIVLPRAICPLGFPNKYRNQTLANEECMSNCDLREGVQYFAITNRCTIEIKRMGELGLKVFQDTCKYKFKGEEWNINSAELCSTWQENIKDSAWYPFKKIRVNGKFHAGVSSAARAKLDFKLVSVSWYQSDLVENDLVAMAEGPNAIAPQVGGPSVNPRPLNTRTRLDQLEDKMQALSGIIDQVTTLEERLDGFSDDQAHVGERLVTLEGVVEGNMATLLDQVAELSSKSSSQLQQRAGSSNNYNKGKNGGYQARSGETKVMARTGVGEQVQVVPRVAILGGSTTGRVTMAALPLRPGFKDVLGT
ncbi:hypothetical protein GIB67_023344 [Kingdonia uniflora]|uniref:Factor of DNA methylation 1-5/IDN2 domain-containing protein n=1 Tax=Kingdonia uniflora TaxID=39325 RepID=A0A7J7LIE6_9MAGN|nr:hypothetical protein GIB67_023344 [Kingdonia uniflora]